MNPGEGVLIRQHQLEFDVWVADPNPGCQITCVLSWSSPSLYCQLLHSPLYVFASIFDSPPAPEDVVGATCLIFWWVGIVGTFQIKLMNLKSTKNLSTRLYSDHTPNYRYVCMQIAAYLCNHMYYWLLHLSGKNSFYVASLKGAITPFQEDFRLIESFPDLQGLDPQTTRASLNDWNTKLWEKLDLTSSVVQYFQ